MIVFVILVRGRYSCAARCYEINYTNFCVILLVVEYVPTMHLDQFQKEFILKQWKTLQFAVCNSCVFLATLKNSIPSSMHFTVLINREGNRGYMILRREI